MAGYISEDSLSVCSSIHAPASSMEHQPLPSLKSATGQSFEDPRHSYRLEQQFRSLVSDIAEHLDEKDVDKIIWQKHVPSNMKDRSALAVLEWLYNHGHYTANNVRPLAQLLKTIHREDMNGKVESYQEEFGESISCTLNIATVIHGRS